MLHNIKRIFLPVVLILLMVSGCGQQTASSEENNTSTIFVMGTVIQSKVYAEDTQDILAGITQVLNQSDKEISWRNDNSAVSAFNQTHTSDMSDVDTLISDALTLCSDSQGAFDITVLPITELWNFDKLADSDVDLEDMMVPTDTEIAATLGQVGYERLSYDRTTHILSSSDTDVYIEMGAIGKGYALSQALEYLKTTDASGGMISAGSSISVYGNKADGSSVFNISLRDPRGGLDDSIGMMRISNCSVSTSGDYERYFEKDGIRYHHILDPRTGYPADSGLMQVTIIGDDSTLCDGLSTACFVLGLEDGMALARKYGVQAIFVSTDRQIYCTEDIGSMFEFTGSSAGYTLQTYTAE